jgi:hypothetical protein
VDTLHELRARITAAIADVMGYYAVSEERIASITRVPRICELGTALAVNSNRSTLRTIGGMYEVYEATGSALLRVSFCVRCLG